VTAYLEYRNGAPGVLVTSSGESPGTSRFEIAGTRGKVVRENDGLSFTCNAADMIKFSRTAKLSFGKPETWQKEVPFENAPAPHATLMQNFLERDTRRLSAVCARRRRVITSRTGQCHFVFIAHRPDGGAADGRGGILEEASAVVPALPRNVGLPRAICAGDCSVAIRRAIERSRTSRMSRAADRSMAARHAHASGTAASAGR